MEAASTSRPDPSSAPARPALVWLLLGLSGILTVVWFVHALGYWEDDAYIHLEFARSVAAGQGFSFNGHVVYGDTSPLWVLLLAAFHRVIPGHGVSGWMTAGKTLTAFAAVFALSGAFCFSRSLVRSKLSASASSLFAATMLLVFVLSPYFGYWAFSGMEALGAGGVVCWSLVAIARTPVSPPRFLIAAFLGGLAPVLRPEMSFFTLLIGLVLLERLFHMGAPLGRRIALLVAGLFLIAAPAILWARYALHTFGMVVPNTNAAKRAGPGDSVPVHLAQIYLFGFPVVIIGLLLLAAWLLWSAITRSRGPQSSASVGRSLHAGGWLLFVWTAINCIFYVADHTYVQTRYIFVTAPLLTIALFAIAVQLFPRAFRALLAFALLFGVFMSTFATWPLVSAKKQIDLIYAELASYLSTLPPEAGVAHYSIGEAAFLSQHTIIDTGGITRPSIIPLLPDPTDDRRIAWMYGEGAQYEVIDHQPLPGAVLVWSHDVPSTRWAIRLHPSHEFEHLMVWKLPPPPPPPRP
jgi:hypothetical protein